MAGFAQHRPYFEGRVRARETDKGAVDRFTQVGDAKQERHRYDAAGDPQGERG
jgi:hypothetical protein